MRSLCVCVCVEWGVYEVCVYVHVSACECVDPVCVRGDGAAEQGLGLKVLSAQVPQGWSVTAAACEARSEMMALPTCLSGSLSPASQAPSACCSRLPSTGRRLCEGSACYLTYPNARRQALARVGTSCLPRDQLLCSPRVSKFPSLCPVLSQHFLTFPGGLGWSFPLPGSAVQPLWGALSAPCPLLSSLDWFSPGERTGRRRGCGCAENLSLSLVEAALSDVGTGR